MTKDNDSLLTFAQSKHALNTERRKSKYSGQFADMVCLGGALTELCTAECIEYV